MHVYEVRPRSDKRGVDLISDALLFGRLWYTKPGDAIDYAKFRSRSHDAVIRVYDEAGKVIETHENELGHVAIIRRHSTVAAQVGSLLTRRLRLASGQLLASAHRSVFQKAVPRRSGTGGEFHQSPSEFIS